MLLRALMGLTTRTLLLLGLLCVSLPCATGASDRERTLYERLEGKGEGAKGEMPSQEDSRLSPWGELGLTIYLRLRW